MSAVTPPPVVSSWLIERASVMPAQQIPTPPASNAPPFSSLLNGLEGVSAKINEADNMVRAFALDDSIPVHQVTFALEQARLSLEMMLQVRNRLLAAKVSEQELKDIDAKVRDIVNEAADFAQHDLEPDTSELYTDVYH